MTSDKKLVAVHDWYQFGNYGGVAFSAKQRKEFRTNGQPITAGRYTTMLIEDVLDEMLVNKDMYIVTDTKSFELSEEGTYLQFKNIYDEAIKKDPELLNRVIPQIYNEQMYEIITEIYEFPNVIYTAYATSAMGVEIIDFAKIHDNINVIVVPYGDGRFNQENIEYLHQSGMLIYAHTIHDYESMRAGFEIGYDGFYTGLLTPHDVNVYSEVIK